jgi:hypothetical protein
MDEKELAAKRKLVSDCMLDSSNFTIAGVVVGTIFGIRKKHLRPLVSFSLIGTLTDIIYGYRVSCDSLIRDLNIAKVKFDADKMDKAVLEEKPNSDKDKKR